MSNNDLTWQIHLSMVCLHNLFIPPIRKYALNQPLRSVAQLLIGLRANGEKWCNIIITQHVPVRFFFFIQGLHLSCRMGKPTICIGKNKGADQLRGNGKADQRLCFRYKDSTIPLLLKSEISLVLNMVL